MVFDSVGNELVCLSIVVGTFCKDLIQWNPETTDVVRVHRIYVFETDVRWTGGHTLLL